MIVDPSALDVLARGALSFVESFYLIHDTKRADLGKFYAETSQLVWNGRPIGGKSHIVEFLQQLPISKHTVYSVDSQPVLASSSSKTMLVVVSGSSRFGEEKTANFTQNFLLRNEGEFYYIASDSFRFV